MHIIDIVNKIHPDIFKFNSDKFIDKLYGSDKLRKTILSNANIQDLFNNWEQDRLIFKEKRTPFLLY